MSVFIAHLSILLLILIVMFIVVCLLLSRVYRCTYTPLLFSVYDYFWSSYAIQSHFCNQSCRLYPQFPVSCIYTLLCFDRCIYSFMTFMLLYSSYLVHVVSSIVFCLFCGPLFELSHCYHVIYTFLLVLCIYTQVFSFWSLRLYFSVCFIHLYSSCVHFFFCFMHLYLNYLTSHHFIYTFLPVSYVYIQAASIFLSFMHLYWSFHSSYHFIYTFLPVLCIYSQALLIFFLVHASMYTEVIIALFHLYFSACFIHLF